MTKIIAANISTKNKQIKNEKNNDNGDRRTDGLSGGLLRQ